MRRAGVRRRVVSFYVLSFLVVVLLTSVLYYRFLWKLHDLAEQQTHAGLCAEIVESLHSFSFSGPHDPLLSEKLRPLLRYNSASELYLIDEFGTVLESFSGHPFLKKSVSLAPLHDFLEKPLDALPIYGTDPLSGKNRVFSAAVLPIAGKTYFLYFVVNGSDHFQSFLSEAWRSGEPLLDVLLLLSVLAFLFLLGLRFLVYFSNRFGRVLLAVKDYEAGNFQSRIREWRRDEFGLFARTINLMAEKVESNLTELEEQDETRRELIANISHDLRSPATHLRLAVDELEDLPILSTSNRDLLKDLRKNSVLLEKTLKELFELTQLETQSSRQTNDFIELEEMIHDLADRITEKHPSAVTVEVNADSSVVLGDAALLSKALGNLLEILLAESPGQQEGAGAPSVFVCLSERREKAPSQRQYLDIRLRTSNPGFSEESAGLGFAVSKKIIELHGSRLNRSETSADFSFHLPLAEAGVTAPS